MGFGAGACDGLVALGIRGTLGTAPLVMGTSLVFGAVPCTGLAAVAGGNLGVLSPMDSFFAGISGLLEIEAVKCDVIIINSLTVSLSLQ